MPEQPREILINSTLSPHAAAFLETLVHNPNMPVGKTDLQEAHPALMWRGNIARYWVELQGYPDLQGRLAFAGEGKAKTYTLLTEENDIGLFIENLKQISSHYEREKNVHPNEKKLWQKRLATAALVAGGMALGAYACSRHKKK